MTRRVAPLEACTAAYVAFATAALAWRFQAALPGRGLIVVAHALLAAVLLLAPRAREGGAVGRFVGEFYPLLLFFSLYSEVGLLNSAVGRSFDDVVQAWELRVFGREPAREWIRAEPWPWLSTLLHAGYLSYYLIVAGAPLALWASGRREAARRTLLRIAATFYACYALFLVFPVAGPRYLFPQADNAATRTLLVAFVHKLLSAGSAWGTAFPSSHVAAALVASVEAWRAWRALGSVLVPLAVLLGLGTVYGQFHYALDAVAGGALAAVVLVTWPR